MRRVCEGMYVPEYMVSSRGYVDNAEDECVGTQILRGVCGSMKGLMLRACSVFTKVMCGSCEVQSWLCDTLHSELGWLLKDQPLYR